jgi:hypothetical protein
MMRLYITCECKRRRVIRETEFALYVLSEKLYVYGISWTQFKKTKSQVWKFQASVLLLEIAVFLVL